MLEYLLLIAGLLRTFTRTRGDLVAENLLLRQQLAILTRPTRTRSPLRTPDRLFWVLVRLVRGDWRRRLVVVTPDMVVRWHRRGWRLFWRWRSRLPLGRRPLSNEVRDLIGRMSRDNPRWGAERIRGELLKLGIVVSNRSIRRYRRSPHRPPSQTWRTFLRNHAAAIWAADLFTVQTLTFRTLYVLLFITHDRRQLVHLAVTAHPAAAWMWRQLVEATPWGRTPRHLVRDRDAVYGGEFAARARGLGIETLLTPVRAPRANAIAERVVRTLRNECLDTSSSSMRRTCARCSASSPRTTTPSVPTGACSWRRQCRRVAVLRRPPGASGRGRCSAAYTTSTSASPEANGILPPFR